jgi:tRNA(Ile)-lysidine synthase
MVQASDMTLAAPVTVEELHALVTAVLPDWFDADDHQKPLAVACSGGPDSLALAILAAQAFPGRVHGLIVDHGLRPESATEAAQTARWLTARHIPAHVLVWEGQKPSSGIQAAARAARYALLASGCDQIGASCLLLAHHQDDQAETFLLALGRGAGLQGLAGMAALRHEREINILRPLLAVPKARLVTALEVMGQPYIQDSSNTDARFDRARLRQQMAALAAAGLTPELLAGAAGRLADARDLMEDMTGEILRHVWSAGGGDRRLALRHLRQMLGSMPGQRQIVVPVLASLIQQVSSARPRFEELYRLAQWIADGGQAGPRTLGRCRISLSGDELVLEPE